MAQLTAVDANFLNVEGGATVAHIGGLGIVDTSQCENGRLTMEDLVELVRERAHLARPLRQRLAEVPLGLDLPYWEDDPDFDPARHVVEVALPRPGDEEQLANEVARLHETPLDRRRPLWELYLVQGLRGGRAALYAKVHHAAVDGVLAAETLAALLDMSPEPGPLPPAGPVETAPDVLRRLGAGLVRNLTYPLRSARSMARTAPYLGDLPLVGQMPGMDWISRAVEAVTRRDTSGLPPQPRLTAPPTPFNGPISAHRRLAYGSLPLDEIKRVSKVLGGSVNDVIMALCATALRRWLDDHAALPELPLIAAIPVSLRRGDAADGCNQLSVMIAPLATDITDPARRFDAVRQAMRTAKRRFVSHSGTWLEEMSGLLPTPIAGPATRQLARFAPRPVNLIVSNVPGPQFPMYVRGARVLAYYPVSVISDVTGGLNITVFSYDGHVDVGVVACRDMVPDVWAVMSHLEDALDELTKLADERGN